LIGLGLFHPLTPPAPNPDNRQPSPMTSTSEPGGFLHPTLPSPPPSSATSISIAPSALPPPRHTPLKPGSGKESSFIDYVDRKLLGISRRYEKRFNADLEDENTSDIEGQGYKSFGEMAKDLENVVDVIWISGTRMTTSTA